MIEFIRGNKIAAGVIITGYKLSMIMILAVLVITSISLAVLPTLIIIYTFLAVELTKVSILVTIALVVWNYSWIIKMKREGITISNIANNVSIIFKSVFFEKIGTNVVK